jgi:tRNA modification GTPase
VHDLSTTLAAVATAPGRGGIGCVRISGPDAFAIARTLFLARKTFELPGDGRPRFGTFLDDDGQPLDHGYLVAFAPQRAFTGEPTVELWSHGSPPVLDALTRAAVARGRVLRAGRIHLPRAAMRAARSLTGGSDPDAHRGTDDLSGADVAFAQLDGRAGAATRPAP